MVQTLDDFSQESVDLDRFEHGREGILDKTELYRGSAVNDAMEFMSQMIARLDGDIAHNQT
jgi:hypothetical protein